VFAAIARWAIIGFAVLIALEQLNIAPNLMNILFTALVGGLALAFGLSFGLGGQEAARRWLNRGETMWENVAPRLSQQIADQQAAPLANGAYQEQTPQPAAGAYATPPATPSYQAPQAPMPPTSAANAGEAYSAPPAAVPNYPPPHMPSASPSDALYNDETVPNPKISDR
jgi:hypothetical protein